MKRRFKRIKWVLLISFIVGILFLHFYAPRFITEINNPLILLLKKNNSKNTQKAKVTAGKYLNFNSFDDTELEAFISYSSSDSTKGTIILLHGIRSNKSHFYKLCKTLNTQGFNAVALDFRAHGNSMGRHCTFGVKEKKDVSELISVLINQEKLNPNIGVWGQSLGGAIGLQAMGTDKRIKFGIIESTFTDFKSITNDYFNYHLGFNISVLTNYLVERSGKIAGFKPEDAQPLKYCKKIDQPILLVHGTKDRRIVIGYGRQNFSQIKSKNKEFIEQKEANHLTVWKKGGQEYFHKIFRFLNQQTN